jgi:NAD(P)-dependent dehydrogenase (short-subunit alcohol dehydrogenase family)
VNLKDNRIIVVGGSSGIGKATAILLSRLEAKVTLIARNEEKLKKTIEELEGSNHKYYCYDVSDVNGIESFVTEIVGAEEIDGFVYCAGTMSNRPLKMLKPEHMLKTMEVNTLAFVEFVRCVTKRRSNMSIVGVSSRSAVRGFRGSVDCCASKGAMDSAIRAMAMELGGRNIRVNSIQPGIVETDMTKDRKDGVGNNSWQELLDRQFLRIGYPEDVANLIAYLLSDASALITGTSIAIDGGLSIT